MARPIRVEYEGAFYHVTARGNERRENHYHFAVETPHANLSMSLGWFQTTYSIRFNRRHHRRGHLYQGRFKAHLVDADAYAKQLALYVHLNPVRPRKKNALIPHDRKKQLKAYPWSSHRAYLGIVSPPRWLSLDWLGYWGRRRGEAQKRYGREVDACFGQVVKSPFEDLRDGLVLGGDGLYRKVRLLLSKSKGQDEVTWTRRAGEREIRQRLKTILDNVKDPQLKIWIRGRLGGERLKDLAAVFGYADGIGILRVVQRVEARSKLDVKLARRLKKLQDAIRC